MRSPHAKNQRQLILDLLLHAGGREVPSVELSRISLQYGARVKELRALGFTILNRTERHDGQVHGFFRLQLGMPTTAKREQQEQPQPRLFPGDELGHTGSWRDPEEGWR